MTPSYLQDHHTSVVNHHTPSTIGPAHDGLDLLIGLEGPLIPRRSARLVQDFNTQRSQSMKNVSLDHERFPPIYPSMIQHSLSDTNLDPYHPPIPCAYSLHASPLISTSHSSTDSYSVGNDSFSNIKVNSDPLIVEQRNMNHSSSENTVNNINPLEDIKKRNGEFSDYAKTIASSYDTNVNNSTEKKEDKQNSDLANYIEANDEMEQFGYQTSEFVKRASQNIRNSKNSVKTSPLAAGYSAGNMALSSSSESNSKEPDVPCWTQKLRELSHHGKIEFSQLVLNSRLGEGAFGEVWRAQLWDMEVAVKILKGNYIRASPYEELAEEVALLTSLRHPNCVLFLGFTNPPNFCIITEYMSLGSLRSILNNEAIRIGSKLIIKIALSIARGMNYLHTQSPAILHRDLNSHNILCNHNWAIKVADYGLSKPMNDASMSFLGAVQWRAPEAKSNHFLPASDVYSYGVLLWEIITRQIPWEGWDVKNITPAVLSGTRLSIPVNCPPVLQNLIVTCWEENPNNRPTFHEIINILRPYEQNVIQHQAKYHNFVTNKDSFGSFSFSAFADCCVTSDLLIFNESTMICRCWETFINYNNSENAIRFIKSQTVTMDPFIAGSLCLVDEIGELIWIVGLDSRASVIEEEKHIHSQTNEIQTFSTSLCAPISRETMKLFSYSLRPGGAVASVIHMSLQEGLGNKTLSLYEKYALPELKELPSWCGAVILCDLESSNIIAINIYDSEEALAAVERQGFFHQQMSNFQYLMSDLPRVQTYKIQVDTFASRDRDRPPPSMASGYSNDILESISRNRQASEGFDSILREFVIIPDTPVTPKLRYLIQDKNFAIPYTIVDSFFCALHYGGETAIGQLHLTEEVLFFKGKRKLIGEGKGVAVPLRDIFSLDKNSCSSMSSSRGHSIECTTLSKEVLCFKGLLHREEFLKLITEQVRKLKYPSHTILMLRDGEPIV